jgi:uncharacterized protein DUF4013
MEYLRGWRVWTRDPDRWSKLGVATLLLFSTAFVPVLGQLVLGGWLALALRRAVFGKDELPRLDLKFDYLGKLVGLGLRPFLAQLLWSLPAIVLCSALACFGAMVPAFVRVSDNPDWMPIAILVGVGLIFVLLVPIVILAQVAVLRASLMDELGPAVEMRGVFRMTRILLKELVVGHLILIPAAFVLALLGLVACYFGIFPVAVITNLVFTYWYAELYAAYLKKEGEPLAIGAVDVES